VANKREQKISYKKSLKTYKDECKFSIISYIVMYIGCSNKSTKVQSRKRVKFSSNVEECETLSNEVDNSSIH
jgi:hypothetical protein